MVSRPIAAARRSARRLLGRYSLQVQIGGAVSGAWLWRVTRVCAVPWHLDCTWEVASGHADTRNAARAAALAIPGRHDEVTERHVFGAPAVHAWPREPSLWVQAAQIALPDHLRGNGSVVAADASYRASDRHAGWGVVTDAGWYQRGKTDYGTSTVAGLELLAIGRALLFYPHGHVVDVLTDSVDAYTMARRILAGKLQHWLDAPGWMPYEAFTALHKVAGRHLRVRVIDVKSKTHPLHNIADRLARGRDFYDLLQPKEDT